MFNSCAAITTSFSIWIFLRLYYFCTVAVVLLVCSGSSGDRIFMSCVLVTFSVSPLVYMIVYLLVLKPVTVPLRMLPTWFATVRPK